MKSISRALSIAQPASPPTEFRIFKAGVNSTSKGDFVFDATAAKSVMSAFDRQGVDLPIDLDHMSLNDPASANRTDAGDARGWFALAVRNGELWAVHVRWTPDGLARLAARSQRYISPAFSTVALPDGTERVVAIANAALVAMPATHGAPALVAASSGVLGVRVSAAALASVRALAKARRTTVSQVLLSALATVAGAGYKAPTPDQVSALKALLASLGVAPDASQKDILAAIGSVLQTTALDAGPDVAGGDPLSQSVDRPPAKLSAQRLSAAPALTADEHAIAAQLPEYAKQKFLDQRAERAARDRQNAASTAYQRENIARHEARSKAMIAQNKKAK